MTELAVFIVVLWIVCFLVRLHESRVACGFDSELRRMWKSAGFSGRILAILVLILCTQSGGSKGISPLTNAMRLLFWNPGSPWQLMTASDDVRGAQTVVSMATNRLHEASEATNSAIYTLSFDWHVPQRLPYHVAQNVMAYTTWVYPTNINGVAYEDHCVAFNALASTNPAVIYIEYARTSDDGAVERYTSQVVTSSYPDTVELQLQSGSYTCYWYRCAVPPAFTNSVRDWSGEALFGAPYDSGKGFDLLGTLVVDNGNDVWVGANTNMVIGGVTNVVRNGVVTED